MCDHDSLDDMMKYQLRSGELSRRSFGALTLGAGFATLIPTAAGSAEALDVQDSEVNIRTPDGTADSYFVHPAKGSHPGVLIWPDIFGLRPAFRQMGKRPRNQAIPCWSSIRSTGRSTRRRPRSTRISTIRQRVRR